MTVATICFQIVNVSFSYCLFTVDGDLSINALVFLQTRAYKKESASLVASGPRAHIHLWNVFQGGKLMAQFPGVLHSYYYSAKFF